MTALSLHVHAKTTIVRRHLLDGRRWEPPTPKGAMVPLDETTGQGQILWFPVVSPPHPQCPRLEMHYVRHARTRHEPNSVQS